MYDDKPIATKTISAFSAWLGINERLSGHNLTLLRQQLVAVCQDTPRDTIQEWLTNLDVWDRITRLDTWLITTGNAADTPVNRFISRLVFLSLVHRAFHPGSMYRYVVILEGAEDIGKSELIRQLGGQWAKSLSARLDGKEASMQLKGVWLAEFAELEASARRTRPHQAFIRRGRHYVPKFETAR
jgi:predicted P-loop ATPase